MKCIDYYFQITFDHRFSHFYLWYIRLDTFFNWFSAHRAIFQSFIYSTIFACYHVTTWIKHIADFSIHTNFAQTRLKMLTFGPFIKLNDFHCKYYLGLVFEFFGFSIIISVKSFQVDNVGCFKIFIFAFSNWVNNGFNGCNWFVIFIKEGDWHLKWSGVFLKSKHQSSKIKTIIIDFLELGIKLLIIGIQTANTFKQFFFGTFKFPFLSWECKLWKLKIHNIMFNVYVTM